MIAATFLAELKSRRIVISTVESCTGGLLAHRITDIAGSSENFWGSWCTYDNSAKQLLGVSAELIREHGVVSKEVAQAMAEAGLAQLRAALSTASPKDLGIITPFSKLIVLSTTGVAGPTGGSVETPVGLCFVGLVSSDGFSQTRKLHAPTHHSREQNKEFFASETFRFALEVLRSK